MPEDRRIPFSERIGAVRRVIQKDTMDAALKNELWNLLLMMFENDNSPMELTQLLLTRLWTGPFGQKIDDLPDYFVGIRQAVRLQYDASEWYRVYDCIEFIAA